MPPVASAFYSCRQLGMLLLALLAGVLGAVAQPLAGLASRQRGVIVQVGAVPATGHTWADIQTDTALAFASADSLRPAQSRRYWLRLALTNPSHYEQATELTVLPSLDNTYYYYDEDARAWCTRRVGMVVATDSQRVKGGLPLRLPAQATSPVYVLVNLDYPASLQPAVRLQVQLKPLAEVQQTNAFSSTAWAVSVAVLGLLLLTNVPTYLRYRDRPTLFYICLQVGGVLYVTAYRNYFRMLWPTPVFSYLLQPTGLTYAYGINSIFMHLSVVLMLLGFVQMTRAYLATATHLPRLDAALRRGLGGYIAFTVVVGAVNLSGFLLNYYSLRFDNALVFGLLVLLLLVTVTAYRQRLPLARPYLLANVLPILCVMSVAAYYVVMGYGSGDGSKSVQVLPDVAIMAHALFFSAALSIRLQLAQRTLLATERTAASLMLDIQAKELRNREIILKNSHIQTALLAMHQRQQAHDEHTQQLSQDHHAQQAANLDLQQQLEANQRELASTTLYVQQKNALLAELRQQLGQLRAQGPASGPPQELAGVQSLLQSSLYLDEDWGKFKRHFEQVHPRFFEDLQANYPALTKHEQRLYSYFHINLSTKEIAALLNIDPASVRRAKTRLYKKIAAADQAAGRPTASPEA